MAATEDIHLEPGTTSTKLVLSLDGSTTLATGANPTLSPPVTTTPPENTNHAATASLPHHAKNHAPQDTVKPMIKTNGLLHLSTQSPLTLRKSKLKS